MYVAISEWREWGFVDADSCVFLVLDTLYFSFVQLYTVLSFTYVHTFASLKCYSAGPA